MTSLQSLLQSQCGGQPSSDLEELLLDEWRGAELSPTDKSLLEGCTALQFLSLNGCGLKSLRHFPALPALLKLDLNDNKISTGLESIAGAQKLLTLSLAGNLIKTLTDLQPLVSVIQSALPELVSLDLFNCPVSKVAGYREAVFKLLPKLEVLDRLNQQGEEVSDMESEELDDSVDFDDDGSGSDEDSDEGPVVLGLGLTKSANTENGFLSAAKVVELSDESDDSEEDEDEERKPGKKRKN